MPWKISVSIKDDKGKRSTLSYYLADEVEFSEVETYARDHALTLNPLIEGAIVKINVSHDIGLPAGLRAEPNPVADVEEKMKLSFLTDDLKTVTHAIPTFSRSFSAYNFGEERVLDLLEPEAAAYLSLLLAASDSAYTFDSPVDNRGGSYLRLKKTAMKWRPR